MEFGWINFVNLGIIVIILAANIVYGAMYGQQENKCKSGLANSAEQIGRYACMALMILPLGIEEFGFSSVGLMLFWLIGCGVLLLAYIACWVFYLINLDRKFTMPLAILPGIIFIICAVTLKHWALLAFAIIFTPAHVYVTVCNNYPEWVEKRDK